jgi:hypothetical protein
MTQLIGNSTITDLDPDPPDPHVFGPNGSDPLFKQK